MNIRLTYRSSALLNGRTEVDNVTIDLGDLQTLTEQLHARGAAGNWQHVFMAMTNNDIQGMHIRGDGDVELVR